MSKTSKKIDILTRAASSVAMGAALGSSLGLYAGAAFGSLVLPGVGTIVGATIGAFLASYTSKNLLGKTKSSDEKLLVILDSITDNNEVLKKDIMAILESSIESSQEDNIKELLIKMQIAVNLAELQRPQKTEISIYITEMLKGLELNDMVSVRYFLDKIAESVQKFPNILDIYRELKNYLLD